MDPKQFLQAHPLIERDTTQIAIAIYGTPTLGDLYTWNRSEPVSVSRQLTAWEGAIADGYAMWDEENLYVLADVTVSDLNASGDNIHNKDSIDIISIQPI